MLLAPLVLGALSSGPRWVHLLLLVAWLVAYLAFYATGLWLRARRRPRYRPPVLAYGAATAVLGLALLAVEPRLAWWAPVYAPLLLISLAYSVRRRDRALGNDLVTVVAACLMAVVAYGLGSAGASESGPPPGASSGEAWLLALVLLGYFFGTVLYVKTMIRERGNRGMYVASVLHHLLVALGAALTTLPWTVPTVLGLLAVRAAVVPRRWPGATPKQLGIGEIVATVVLSVALLTA